MTNFLYTRDIPNAPNNPSNDQPIMKVNTNSIMDLIAVDHVTFGADDGGTHDQVTITSQNTPGGQVNPTATIFTAIGSNGDLSSSTVSKLFYRNANSIFPLSGCVAYGLIDGAGGVGSLLNTYNISSVTPGPIGGAPTTVSYLVILNSNAVTGNNYSVIAHPINTTALGLTFQIKIFGTANFYITGYYFNGSTFVPTTLAGSKFCLAVFQS